MLRLVLPPNLAAAVLRDAIPVKVELDPHIAPTPALFPVLAHLQRLCGTSAHPLSSSSLAPNFASSPPPPAKNPFLFTTAKLESGATPHFSVRRHHRPHRSSPQLHSPLDPFR